jgi:hypothetical protein
MNQKEVNRLKRLKEVLGSMQMCDCGRRFKWKGLWQCSRCVKKL